MAINTTNENDWFNDIQRYPPQGTAVVLFGNLPGVNPPTVIEQRTEDSYEELEAADEIINQGEQVLDFYHTEIDSAASISSVGNVPTTIMFRNGIEIRRHYADMTAQDIIQDVSDFIIPDLNSTVAFDDEVYSIRSDSNGGWFVGGAFTKATDEILGSTVRSDISLTNFINDFSDAATDDDGVPNYIDGRVYAIIPDGSGGYIVGGDFSRVGKTARKNLARFDSSGVLQDWNPQTNDVVRALALDGSNVIVGGDFSFLGGKTRQRIGAVPLNSSTATDWNPGANGAVHALAIFGSEIVVGGDFTGLGGESRNYLGSVPNNGNSATSWDPNLDGRVNAIVAYFAGLFVGGEFTQVGVDPRNYVAFIDHPFGAATSWAPDPTGGIVTSLAISDDGYLMVGGAFSNFDGLPRTNIAQVDLSTLTTTAWDPSPSGPVYSIAVSPNNNVIFGGNFNYPGLNDFFRIVTTTSDINVPKSNPSNSSVNGIVRAVAFHDPADDSFAIGGDFCGRSWETREHLAQVTSGGTLSGWTCNVNGSVYALETYTTTNQLFVGGNFSQVGGDAHANFAVVDMTTGGADVANVDADDYVYVIKRPFPNTIAANLIYVGGKFQTIGGQSRDKLACFDSTDLAAGPSAWNPGINPSALGAVYDIDVVPGTGIDSEPFHMIVGGDFNAIGVESRSNIGSVSVVDGSVKAWNPGTDSTVRALAVNGSNIYIGGSFVTLGGTSTLYAGAVEYGTDTVFDDWAPEVNGPVYALKANVRDVFIGGAFGTVNSKVRESIASVSAADGTLNAWHPGVELIGAGVVCLDTYGISVAFGGSFIRASITSEPVPPPVHSYFTIVKMA